MLFDSEILLFKLGVSVYEEKCLLFSIAISDVPNKFEQLFDKSYNKCNKLKQGEQTLHIALRLMARHISWILDFMPMI